MPGSRREGISDVADGTKREGKRRFIMASVRLKRSNSVTKEPEHSGQRILLTTLSGGALLNFENSNR